MASCILIAMGMTADEAMDTIVARRPMPIPTLTTSNEGSGPSSGTG